MKKTYKFVGGPRSGYTTTLGSLGQLADTYSFSGDAGPTRPEKWYSHIYRKVSHSGDPREVIMKYVRTKYYG